MEKGIQDLRDAVISWQSKRKPLAEKFSQDSMRGFAEAMNFHTRQLISVLETSDPEFYSALLELSQHAGTMVSDAKFFVNKTDRTNL